MQMKQLGRSGLYVTELAMGAMNYGDPTRGCDEETAIRLLHAYVDAGGNFIDTADAYGRSEELVGKALQGQRERVVVATKVGLLVGPGPHDRGLGRIRIRTACEESLRRLQTDRIDLYQVHIDDPATPLEETITALDDLVRAGKVLYVGASNYLSYRLMKALDMSDQLQAARFVSFQGQYNLAVRTLEREHFPLLAEEGLGFLSWSPLGRGLLTGKIPRGPLDTGAMTPREAGLAALSRNEHGFDVVKAVVDAAGRIGCSPAQLAIAWQRTKPVASVILGARTMEQLQDNLGSLDVTIPDDVLAELDRVSAVPAEYPRAFLDLFQDWIRGAN